MTDLVKRLRDRYSKHSQELRDEAANEIERLQARVERLLELHRRNLNDVRAWGDLASHHCDWRVRAEGMAERSRAATEQGEKDG